MKLMLEIARRTSEGKVLLKVFKVGESIRKKHLQELFSEYEQEDFMKCADFELGSKFDEKTYKIKLTSTAQSIKLNGEAMDRPRIYRINSYNDLLVGDYIFKSVLIVCGERRRRFGGKK